MVTNWLRHWDDLAGRWGNSTLFTLPIINDGLANGPWPEEAVTLFIKRSKEHVFEKSWLGKTKNFHKDSINGKPAIRFEVSDLKEVDCPPQFKQYSNGWHANKLSLELPLFKNEVSSQSLNLQPAFFNEMSTCDPFTFELYCFHLLRLLGIHNIHKIPQDDNRGKADGFFNFHSLSIIYDATLETNYQKKKETQIENYINQLKKEELTFGAISYGIKENQKQVWIITRGSKVDLLKTKDSIKVKEIPFSKLIEVYHKRLNEEINEDELWNILKDLN